MIFERISAKGFGLLEDVEIRLRPGLNLLMGDNETGKTTVAEAVFAALYGLRDTSGAKSRARKEVKRLEPWQGGAFHVGLDLLLEDGRRLAVTRRLGAKDDLLVFDVGIGMEVGKRLVAGREDLGQVLLGIGAGLFRDSYFIPQLTLPPSGGPDAFDRIANLEESGRDDTSLTQALAILDEAQSRLGKTDLGRGTPMGRAAQRVEDLERELREAQGRRESLFDAEAHLARIEGALPAKREALAALERRLQGARKLAAASRLRQIAATEERLRAIEARLGILAPFRAVDVASRARVRQNLERARARLEERRGELEGLARKRESLGPLPEGLPPEGWVEEALQALRRLSASRTEAAKASGRRRILWGGAVGWALVGGALLLALPAKAPAVIAFLLALGSLALAGTQASRIAQAGRPAEEAARDLARQARLTELTPEGIADVEHALQTRRAHDELARWEEELLRRVGEARDDLRQAEADASLWPWGMDEEAARAAQEEAARLEADRQRLREELVRLRGPSADALAAQAAAEVPEDDGDPEALLEEISGLSREIHGLEASFATFSAHLREQRASVGDLPGKEAALIRAVAERDALRARRDALGLARAVLEQVGEAFQRDVTPRLNRELTHWLHALSEGRYGEAAVGKDTGPRIRTPDDGQFRAPDALSQGTRDLVYLALRLALVALLPGEGAPLILDDPCVNMDSTRTARVMGALRDLAATRQVLYLTCHEREADLAARMGARILRAPWREGDDIPSMA